jgi:predicted MFS family arabinose efflux permease
MLPAMQMLYINLADHTQRGTASSTYLFSFDVGVSLGMFFGGYISGLYSFETLYIVSSLLCLLGVAVYLLVSRSWFERRKLRSAAAEDFGTNKGFPGDSQTVERVDEGSSFE